MKKLKNFIITPFKKMFNISDDVPSETKYDFSCDGISYVIISADEKKVKVVAGDRKYSGDIVIPQIVNFKGTGMAVVRISGYSFFHCKELKSVSFGDIVEIGGWAFEGCENLVSLNFGNVRTIGNNAFKDCTSLRTINFGSVEEIEDNSFRDCTSLESLELPNVVNVCDKNFKGCRNLVSVKFNKLSNLGTSVFHDCTSLRSVSLGNVETLRGLYAEQDTLKQGVFKNCTNLHTISMGRVKAINDCAFFGCTSISAIRIESATPPEVTMKSFPENAYTATLYVPKGSADVYRKHEVWGRFIIEEFAD